MSNAHRFKELLKESRSNTQIRAINITGAPRPALEELVIKLSGPSEKIKKTTQKVKDPIHHLNEIKKHGSEVWLKTPKLPTSYYDMVANLFLALGERSFTEPASSKDLMTIVAKEYVLAKQGQQHESDPRVSTTKIWEECFSFWSSKHSNSDRKRLFFRHCVDGVSSGLAVLSGIAAYASFRFEAYLAIAPLILITLVSVLIFTINRLADTRDE